MQVNVAADELNKRVVLQPGRGNETCFRKCFLPMDTGITFADRNSSSAQEEEDGGNLDCSRVCIANERICDNTIDLINPLTNLTSGGSYTFLPLLLPPPGNRTKEVQLPLLFPDELYCLSRALPAFSINYLITCICFFLAIALLYYTLPLLSFFWRRSRRRVQKSRARVDRGGAADLGGPYGSLGES